MKKFWKKTEGFTLVELIVVIAILGILAGIGTVGYSGYVKKANMAADQQLVAAINTAFSSACIENGVNHASIVSAEESWDGKSVDGIDSISAAGLSTEQANAIIVAFAKYYAGNEGNEFRTVNDLMFSNGVFSLEGATKAAYGGGYITFTAEQIEKLGLTTFVTADTLGIEETMNKVSEVTKFVASMGDSAALQKVYSSPDFIAHAAQAMGITLAPDDPNFAGAMTDKVNGLVQDMMDKNPGMTQAQAKEQVYANAAVLHAAKNAADSTKMSQEDIIDLLSNDGAQGNIVANLNQDPSKALSQAALAYGMYTAYAHSTGRQELIDNTDTPTAVLGQLDDDGFQAYINSDKGKTDLEGYLAALEMINSSSNDTDAVSELLVNGFNDPELVNIINNAVGE